jgi:transcriptional regulator with XRE-family HTH domain
VIRANRKRGKNPIEKLAEEANLTAREWRELEQGRLTVSYTTLTTVLKRLGIPLGPFFDTDADDFFPFARMAFGTDPRDLPGEEANELYALYVELMAFREQRSEGSSGSKKNSGRTE